MGMYNTENIDHAVVTVPTAGAHTLLSVDLADIGIEGDPAKYQHGRVSILELRTSAGVLKSAAGAKASINATEDTLEITEPTGGFADGDQFHVLCMWGAHARVGVVGTMSTP